MGRFALGDREALVHTIKLVGIHVPDQAVQRNACLLSQIQCVWDRRLISHTFGKECLFCTEYGGRVESRSIGPRCLMYREWYEPRDDSER